MHIHARSLRYFDMIRRCGSIREAARQMHVASSALNRQLLQLEGEIGSPLFERLPVGMRLTAAGELFARHVINVLQDEQRLTGELDALKGIRRGHLRIVAAESLSTDFLPRTLSAMRAAYPLVSMVLERSGSDAAAASVAGGDADVAIGYSLERADEIEQFAVGRFAMGAVVPAAHALTQSRQTTFTECARYPLILPTREISNFDLIEQAIRHLKRPVDVAMRVGSIGLLTSLAARGLGVAFSTRIGMERELSEGILVHVPLKAPARMFSDLGVYTRAKSSRPPALDAFLRIVGAEIERLVGEEP